MGLLDRLDREARASLENPTTSLSHPASWLVSALGGAPSAAGVSVTPDAALTVSAYFACMNKISGSLGTLPFITYKRLAKGKARAYDRPEYDILHDVANREMPSNVLRRAAIGHVLGWGNAYLEKEYSVGGELLGLWPLLPDRTRPVRKNGEKFIVTRINKDGVEKEVALPAERVVHIYGLGFDGLKGYGVLSVAYQSLGVAIALQKFVGKFFAQGAHMGHVMTHPGSLTKGAKERLRDDIEVLVSGLDNAHRIAVLEEGLKLEHLALPNDQAQLLESQQFSVVDMCRFFNVPPHKIQHLEQSTNNNIEHQGIEWVTDTLAPWAVTFEQAFNMSLFTREERKQYFVEHLFAGLLRGTLKERYEAYRIGVEGGWLKPNDICEFENMNPIPDDQGGNTYRAPLNFGPAGQLGQGAKGAEDIADRVRQLVLESLTGSHERSTHAAAD